jgi:hypothetical protein
MNKQREQTIPLYDGHEADQSCKFNVETTSNLDQRIIIKSFIIFPKL